MTVIKLFCPRELVIGYFKSFGIDDQAVLQKMADAFLKSHNTDDAAHLFAALDDKAYMSAILILGHTHLTKSELIGYFKMLCLISGVNDVNFFEKMTKDKLQKLKKHFSSLHFQGTPTLSPSKMVPQKIKVYKPLLPLKKHIKHLFKRGGSHGQK